MKKIKIEIATNDLQFVGLKINNNSINITFPIGYNIEEKEIKTLEELKKYKEDILILFTTLEKNKDNDYHDGNEKFSFLSASYLIEHYLKYGLYKETSLETNYKNTGQINWKKTITKTEPIYYNETLIYNNYYTNTNNDLQNIITTIQKYCLNISIKIIGWLYKIDDYHISNTLSLTPEEMLYYLNKELQITNEDNKKILLKELIYFIKGTSISEINQSKKISIGRNNFDKTWENILRNNLYKHFQKIDCTPKSYYKTNKGTIIENSNLIPDIIIKYNDKIIIIDAKYYQINSLPQTSDICKQIFYGEYVKNKYKQCQIINIFLLPNNIKNAYQYYASAYVEHSKEQIKTYYIDTKTVLQSKNIYSKLLENALSNNS